MTEHANATDGTMSVVDDEVLLRRVHSKQIRPDGSLTSAAFNDRQLSVHRELFRSRRDIQAAFPKHAIAEFTAGEARSVADVDPDPLPEDISHALVLCRGVTQSGLDRFSTTLKRFASAHWNPSEHLPSIQTES